MARLVRWLVVLGALSTLAGCGGQPASARLFQPGHLVTVDYLLIVIYLVAVVGMGLWLGRGQHDTEEFFLASRKMHWLPVGISIMATLFSAISYLGYPGEFIGYGITFVAAWVTFVAVAPVIMFGFMPVYHRLQVTSAYEMLERRFDVRVRALASGLFIVVRLGWMALAVYTSSLALSAVTPFTLHQVIWVCGLGATVYTIVGGMRAVIWTDVAQFVVLVGGLLGAMWLVHAALDGGFMQAFHLAREYDAVHPESFRMHFHTDLSWTVRMTIWGLWIGNAMTYLSDYGCDQVSVQRYLTNPDLKGMQRSFAINLVAVLVVLAGLALVGIGLWAYFQQHPDPVAAGLKPDKVFPYFIAAKFPAGLSGLMIAALLAATMSSIDSGLNSVTTAVMVDFGERFGWLKGDGERHLRQARLITCVIGLAITILALYVQYLGDNIIEITNKVNNAPKGLLLGIFVLALTTRRVTANGALLAAAVGFVVAVYAQFYWPVETRPTFLWLTLIGFVPTLLVGLLSGVYARPRAEQPVEPSD